MKKSVIFLILILLSFSTHATKWYVDLNNGSDTNSGADWNNPRLTLASAATLGSNWDSIMVKGDTWTTNSTFTFPASRKYFGSCLGNETLPSQRPMSDLDNNGIIEPWEFTYATILSSTNTGNGFNYPNSGITVDGFTFTQTQSTFLQGNRILTLGYTTNNLVNSRIRDCNLTCAVSASPFSILISCSGSISNCLIENNTVSVTTSGGTDCNIQPIVGISGGTLSNSLIRNNKVNLDYSGGTSNMSNTRGLIVMITPTTIQNTSVVSNCVIHNNEVYFKGNTNTTLTNGAIVAMHNSPANSYSYLYNCTIANNKVAAYSGNTASGWALRVIYAGTNTIAHNVYNNVFWNNTGTAGAIGAATSGTQAGYGILSNNVGNGPAVLNNTSPNVNNLSDLGTSNAGTKSPYFISPTIIAGNTTDLSSEKSNWAVSTTSYLIGKGTTTSISTDKADVAYASTPSSGAYEFTYFRSKTSGDWNSGSTWQISPDNSIWSSTTSNPSRTYAGGINVMSGDHVTISNIATASALIIEAGGQLTLNEGDSVKVTSFSIQSDLTKSGTFVDENTNGELTVNENSSVQQYMTAGRNWYISSPLSDANSAVFDAVNSGTNKLYWYDETHGTSAPWVQITDNATELSIGKGYVASLPTDGNIVFTGALNTGDIDILLSRTTGQTKEGFNLVGNPYASYVDARTAINANGNISPSIWYRTTTSDVNPVYYFETVNTTTGIGTNNAATGTVTGLIPPLQAFWVRTSSDNQTLSFSNSLRSHAGNATTVGGLVPTTPLKVTTTKTELVRIQVTNGINSDETVLYFNPNASPDFDPYDSPKMSNNNVAIPEIYTMAGSEQLVINGMSQLPIDSEIALGFRTLTAGNFSISASTIENISTDLKLYLKDKASGDETNISENNYSFSSDITNNIDRFAVIFKSTGATTNIMGVFDHLKIIPANRNEIRICGGDIEGANIAITDISGKMIYSEILKSSDIQLNHSLVQGTYIVKIYNSSKIFTQKIIIL